MHTDIEKWNHFQDQLGFDTVWSIWEVADIDTEIFTNKPRTVFYTFIDEGVTVEELIANRIRYNTVSAVAANGTVRELWAAAESCYQQARALGDWHYFVEDFVMQDNGTLKLVTGS